MSGNFPSLTGREVVLAMQRLGFVIDRITGSHHIMKKEGHRLLVTVPVHGAQTVKRGTLNGIVRSAGLTMNEFLLAVREEAPTKRDAQSVKSKVDGE